MTTAIIIALAALALGFAFTTCLMGNILYRALWSYAGALIKMSDSMSLATRVNDAIDQRADLKARKIINDQKPKVEPTPEEPPEPEDFEIPSPPPAIADEAEALRQKLANGRQHVKRQTVVDDAREVNREMNRVRAGDIGVETRDRVEG
jgi:hypothetical protein